MAFLLVRRGALERSGGLEPNLKVAGAGLDNSARLEAVCREPRKRDLAEIVESGETMLPV
jgi:hypothetical protein